MSIEIRHANDSDWPQLWPIVREVTRRGDTYPFERGMDEATARHVWMDIPTVTCLASRDGVVVGTYYIKPNHGGPGAHVCNAGYMVAGRERRGGVGRAMGEHSLRQAAALGFRAMQFNLVVATNRGAAALWRQLGFQVIGTVPEVFEHPEHGFVGAHIMYRKL